MLYGGEVTVPKSTTQDDPVETTFELTYGVITRVMFYPRPGHAGLVHVQVDHWEHQIFPLDPEQDLHGDSHPIIWEEWYELFYSPFELKVRAWNDDDTYAHTFDIWFDVLPPEALPTYAFREALTSLYLIQNPREIPLTESA
jgi:hypothetical protein